MNSIERGSRVASSLLQNDMFAARVVRQEICNIIRDPVNHNPAARFCAMLADFLSGKALALLTWSSHAHWGGVLTVLSCQDTENWLRNDGFVFTGRLASISFSAVCPLSGSSQLPFNDLITKGIRKNVTIR